MNNKLKKISLFIVVVLVLCMVAVPSFAYDSVDAGEFDYEKLSVSLSGKIGNSGVKTATVFIIPEGSDINAISDTNPPVFGDVVTTDTNGAFDLTVAFFESGTPFAYGTYDVYVYSKDLASPLTDSFTYLSPQEILDNKKAKILNEVKSSQTWNGMRAAILGEDMGEEVINDNFAHINPDTTDYNSLQDKEMFFVELYKAKSNIEDFDDIAEWFEKIAAERKTAENTPVSNDLGGGGNTGSKTPSMSTNPPVDTNQNSGGQTYFKDMSGHWAEAYVNGLYKKGVINGYENGNFEPDNSVTRAELVKIISASFGIGGSSVGEFSDVSYDEWYAPYVNGASAAGIVNGFDGNFRPNDPVTRQDAAVMIHRAIIRTHKLGIGYVFFADETSIASYASEPISELAQIGVVTGNAERQFMPLSNLTRGEAAALISRAADYILAH